MHIFTLDCHTRIGQQSRRHRRCGFSLLETVAATVIVSISLIASMRTLAFVVSATGREANSERATEIAQLILTEITSKPFEDPDLPTVIIGVEIDELLWPPKQWDDCDDYDRWSTSSITDASDTVLPLAVGWSASIRVRYVDEVDPSVSSLIATQLKKISLTLNSPNSQQFSFSALRCNKGVLLHAQAAGSLVLAGAEILVDAAGQSSAAATRIHNQQESN